MSATRGPWSVMLQNLMRQPCDPRCPDLYQVPVTAGNAVATVYSGHHSGEQGKEECLANATLISAAPDLLAICEEIARDSRCDLVDSERRIRLYAAIRKAGGIP